MVRPEPHPAPVVCATAYASRLAPAVTLTAPAMSKPPPPRPRPAGPGASAGSTRTADSMTTAPTGTLIRKIHRQPTAETSTPPSTRPSVPAAADTLPHTANARFRPGPAGNSELSIASVIGTTNAAAIPSTARVAIMTAVLGATAEPSDA